MARGRGQSSSRVSPSVSRSSPARSAGSRPLGELDSQERAHLIGLFDDGSLELWRAYLDSGASVADLITLRDIGDAALSLALRRTRALRHLVGRDLSRQVSDLRHFEELAGDYHEEDRSPDPRILFNGKPDPARSVETVARWAWTLTESVIGRGERMYAWPDIKVELPVSEECFGQLERRARFTRDPVRSKLLRAVWQIDEGYKLVLEAIDASSGDWHPAGRSFRAETVDSADPGPAVSLETALGGDHCPHKGGRWFIHQSSGGPHAAHLECEDCLRGRIAVVPLHQIDPDGPFSAPELEEMSSLVGEEAYLRAQRFHQTLAGDERAVRSLDQLQARDGFLSMDPADYATGAPPTVRPQRTMTVASAMKRR